MLSGIGPAGELAKHDIPLVLDSPQVGRNLHDHFSFNQWWKLRYPETGLSIGTPLWNSPAYGLGLPCDWNVTIQTPHNELVHALKADGQTTDIESHQYLAPDFCHSETIVVYAPAGAMIVGVDIPMGGTHIATAVLGMVPTSHHAGAIQQLIHVATFENPSLGLRSHNLMQASISSGNYCLF